MLPRDSVSPFFLTHVAPRVFRLAAQLGEPARALPMFELKPLLDAAAARELAGELAGVDLLIFVSPSAVEMFDDWIDPGALRARPTVGLIGGGSQLAWQGSKSHDCAAALVIAGALDADAKLLAEQLRVRGARYRRAVVICGEGGARELPAALAPFVDASRLAPIYRREPTGADRLADAGLIDCWRLDRPVRIALSMTEAADRLCELADRHDPQFGHWLRRQSAWAIHSRIAARARALRFAEVTLIAPGVDALRLAIQSR